MANKAKRDGDWGAVNNHADHIDALTARLDALAGQVERIINWLGDGEDCGPTDGPKEDIINYLRGSGQPEPAAEPPNPKEPTMLTFRKKPVEIEAFQMTPERRASNAEWPEWLHRAWNIERGKPGALQPTEAGTDTGTLSIITLEGEHLVSWGDWIIRGVKGELYPCKPDIFAATYEAVYAAEPPQVCHWTETEVGLWEASCGFQWELGDEDHPGVAGMCFCPRCGERLEWTKYKEPPMDEEKEPLLTACEGIAETLNEETRKQATFAETVKAHDDIIRLEVLTEVEQAWEAYLKHTATGKIDRNFWYYLAALKSSKRKKG